MAIGNSLMLTSEESEFRKFWQFNQQTMSPVPPGFSLFIFLGQIGLAGNLTLGLPSTDIVQKNKQIYSIKVNYRIVSEICDKIQKLNVHST